jgi:hypothetical protein
VGASTLWTAAFTVALWRPGVRLRVPMLAALVVLGVYARPECRVLVVPLVPLLLTRDWSWRDRLVLAGWLAVGLIPYLLRFGKPDGAQTYSIWHPWAFIRWHVLDPAAAISVTPLWAIALGVLGLLVGKLRLGPRFAALLALGGLSAVYMLSASETNPLWGLWRYWLAIIPFLALGVGAFFERLPKIGPRTAVLSALVGASLLTGVYYGPLLARPIDSQVEFSYILETTPTIAAANKQLLVLVNERRGQIRHETIPVTAIATALGPTNWPQDAGSPPPSRGAWLIRHSSLLQTRTSDSRVDLAGAALFLGMYRPTEIMEPLKKRYDLVPIEERVIAAAPMLQYVNTQCLAFGNRPRGAAIADCQIRVGWYRVVPRGG